MGAETGESAGVDVADISISNELEDERTFESESSSDARTVSGV